MKNNGGGLTVFCTVQLEHVTSMSSETRWLLTVLSSAASGDLKKSWVLWAYRLSAGWPF